MNESLWFSFHLRGKDRQKSHAFFTSDVESDIEFVFKLQRVKPLKSAGFG